MPEQNQFEQLDRFVDALVRNAQTPLPDSDAELVSLSRVAADLRGLPREDFQERLRSDLERRAAMSTRPALASKAPGRAPAAEQSDRLPSGYPTITPYLIVKGASQFIEFLKAAFEGTERFRVPLRAGSDLIMHAEVAVGNSIIELADASEQYPPAPQTIHLYVPDEVDAVYARALDAGALPIHAPQDQEWGDRTGAIRDGFGNLWYVSMPKRWTPGPQGLLTIQPYLRLHGAGRMILFLDRAFGAKALGVANSPEGKVLHATIQIGNWTLEVDDAQGDSEPMPCHLHLHVSDADRLYARAIGAGATSIEEPADKPYGRSGGVRDAFGNSWFITTHPGDRPSEQAQPEAWGQAGGVPGGKYMPEGFHTLQPYMVAENGEALLDFVKQAFGAEETLRAIGPAGGVHAEVRLGDSMLMVGGGIPGQRFAATPKTTALHIYVRDTDATYDRALAAGAVSIGRPQDHEYGERSASVKDPAGNFWYIATHQGEGYIPEGLRTVNVYLHPRRAEPLIAFLKSAFGAQERSKYASPDGVVHHAEITLGDSVLEMGEAHGPYQPMPSMFYLYVPDVGELYRRALAAGAKSIQEPADQPYGDRNAAVTDAFGNTWFIATHIRDFQASSDEGRQS
jgi:PhnB protein